MLYDEWDLDEYIAVQREEADRQARAEERKIAAQAKLDTAKKAIEMGLSPGQAAKLADLPIAEVETLFVES